MTEKTVLVVGLVIIMVLVGFSGIHAGDKIELSCVKVFSDQAKCAEMIKLINTNR